MHIADACSYQPDDQGSSFLTPDPSVVGNEANRYIRRPMDQGSRAMHLRVVLNIAIDPKGLQISVIQVSVILNSI